MCEGRFSGRSIELTLPVESVRAIYCRDSGQGLAFDDEDMMSEESSDGAEPQQSSDSVSDGSAAASESQPSDKKPTLRLV